MHGRRRRVEVWAQLLLANAEQERITDFFECLGVRRKHVARRMHVTVYHARRNLPELRQRLETVAMRLPASDTRFMVLAPGGENPRGDLVPSEHKIGIRVKWNSEMRRAVNHLRAEFFPMETMDVIGRRSPSDLRRNAFGARHYQPHMTLLRPGSGVHSDLRVVGEQFRAFFDTLSFDRYFVEIVQR